MLVFISLSLGLIIGYAAAVANKNKKGSKTEAMKLLGRRSASILLSHGEPCITVPVSAPLPENIADRMRVRFGKRVLDGVTVWSEAEHLPCKVRKNPDGGDVSVFPPNHIPEGTTTISVEVFGEDGQPVKSGETIATVSVESEFFSYSWWPDTIAKVVSMIKTTKLD